MATVPGAPDPSTMAAIAMGWIEDNVPASIDDGMAEMVAGWRDRGDLPLGALWRPILDRLGSCGCFDAEIDGCRLVLSLQPDQPFFQLHLADALRRSGRAAEAREVLAALQGSDEHHCDALLAMLRLEDRPATAGGLALFDRLETQLLANGRWSARHRDLIDRMIEADLTERAAAFIGQWTERWTIAPSDLGEMGMLAMRIGRPQLARTLFTPVWSALAATPDSIIPAFSGTSPAYDDDVEAEFLARIDAAFARDEASLPRIAPPDHPPPPPGLTVMMLSFEHRALPNDLAEHFSAAAALAGVDLRLYLDSALTMPGDFLGDDSEVARRLEAFSAELGRVRPDVLLIDCVSHLMARGLNPEAAAGLKARFGFRLVCVFRDAHRHAVRDLEHWLPVCDTMVVFDPRSPIFAPERAPLNRRVVPLPVPSLHPPFLERGERDLGMSFVGSVKHLGRHMPLSVLMTEDLDFTAVFGPRRTAETAATAAYARLLQRSRAVLNLSCHGPGMHLVTGRVWESIAAGALLVEQDNPATAMFFAPWRHYLPWTTVDDLIRIGRFVRNRPDQAARMAAEAHAWAGKHYSCDRFWSTVLGHAATPPQPEE